MFHTSGLQFAQHRLIAGYSFRKTGNPLIQGMSTVASTSASCATMARLVARAITVKDVIANSAEHEESKEKVDVDCYVSMKYRGMRNDEIQPSSSCAQRRLNIPMAAAFHHSCIYSTRFSARKNYF
jgi:hypothetical protein